MSNNIVHALGSNTKNVLNSFYSFTKKVITSQTFLVLIFVWFLFQALYIALSTNFGTPPDERYHFEFISYVASNHWLPFFGEQVDTFQLGESSRNPFFIYHYLLSFGFRLFDGYEYGYLILRFLNIFMGIGSLIFVVKIANLLSINKLARNISIFMLANTLMFVFLSASINYDNLFILISLIAVYLFISLLKKPDLFKILLLIATILFGLFIKITFIPIAVALTAVLIFRLRNNFKSLTKNLFIEIKKLNLFYVLVLIPILILGSLLIQRYFVNLVEYKRIEPKCNQVLTIEECNQNALFVRGQYIKETERPEATKSIYEFTFDWTLLMQERTFGIFAHKRADSTFLIFVGSQIFLLLAVLAVIRKYNFRDKTIGAVIAIIIFYCLILLYNNHGSYEKSGNFGFASHGRYLFAVLPLMYLVGNHYILKLLKNNAPKLLFIASVLLIFATAGLPSYIYATDPSWHTSQTKELNQKVKSFMVNIRN